MKHFALTIGSSSGGSFHIFKCEDMLSLSILLAIELINDHELAAEEVNLSNFITVISNSSDIELDFSEKGLLSFVLDRYADTTDGTAELNEIQLVGNIQSIKMGDYDYYTDYSNIPPSEFLLIKIGLTF